jgi:2-pyrone-4,6-dicarboxylate lactonase
LQLLTGVSMAAWASGARGQGAEPAKAIPTIDPSDPNPKPLAFKLPPKSCNTHTHIFGPAACYPFAEHRPYNTTDAPLEAFLTVHEKIDVERCVIVNAAIQQKLLVDDPARSSSPEDI